MLAWLCAQQPQGLVVGVLAWLRSSTQFSHQEELIRSLRVSLAPAAAARPVHASGHMEEQEPTPALPSVPLPPVTLEKVQFALVETWEVYPPAASRQGVSRRHDCSPMRPREVPVPVPRGLNPSVTA